MAGTMNVVFNKLEKFNGTQDFSEWIKNFERCCLIAGKNDDRIKGQLLMLFTDGQPKAILEELEEVAGNPQTLTQCKNKLNSVYDTVAVREDKMSTFEQRTQQLGESEEEFMFALVKLFRGANPDAGMNVLDQAVKRKFLQGIDPAIKRGVFVFCQDPYDPTVSRDQLLQDCRKAKVHLTPSTVETLESKQIVTVTEETTPLVAAISELTNTLAEHMKVTNDKLTEQDERINGLSQRGRRGFSRNNQRGFGRYPSARQNSKQQQQRRWQTSSDRNSRDGDGAIQCFNCGGINHFSRNCLAPRSLNSGNE